MMRPLTRPASEFQVTWSLRLNRFAFDRVDNLRTGQCLIVVAGGEKTTPSNIWSSLP